MLTGSNPRRLELHCPGFSVRKERRNYPVTPCLDGLPLLVRDKYAYERVLVRAVSFHWRAVIGFAGPFGIEAKGRHGPSDQFLQLSKPRRVKSGLVQPLYSGMDWVNGRG